MFSLATPTDHLQVILEKEQEVMSHAAWHGNLTGISCEDILRGKPASSFLLRQGEMRCHYYLSYVIEAPFLYKHQPFIISLENAQGGWGYRNGCNWWTLKLEELIAMIIHQPRENCSPIRALST
jgi:hypothetical protein